MQGRWGYFILGVILGMIGMWFLLQLRVPQAQATEKWWICHVTKKTAKSLYLPIGEAKGHLKNHDKDYRGKCVFHKECVEDKCVDVHGQGENQCRVDKDCEKCCPVEEPCPTECGYEGGWKDDGNCGRKECEPTEKCEEPTPTPTEEPCRENCDAPEVSPNTHRTELTCNGVMPTQPVCTVGHFTDGDSAFLGWWKYQDSASKLMLRYGYSPDNLEYGIDSIPTDSEGIEVNEVATDGHIYYQLGVDRDKCVVWSDVCDP